MADDNWQKTREIFEAALLCQPEDRGRFVADACGGNRTLLSEIESLLESHDSSEAFLELPAIAGVADAFASQAGKLVEGNVLGHYKIISELGKGGMGEVYLAGDQRLDRQVAIKVLTEKFSSDSSNLHRFIREARAASALNHPNILIIHEIGESDGKHYIVSEFIDGKTLRDISNEQALALPEILDITIQIARAICVAHAARLIHRDIKPENIMIRTDGYVKILDFGLAKLIDRKDRGLPGLETLDRVKSQTAKGTIMGTVNYMSPEQAKGDEVDERTDIFSLGAVIYEMVAGSTPFGGDSMAETLANLINAEPRPLSQVSTSVPRDLQIVIEKMLVKDTEDRYQLMTDVLDGLTGVKERIMFEGGPARSILPEGTVTASLSLTTQREKSVFGRRPTIGAEKSTFDYISANTAVTTPASRSPFPFRVIITACFLMLSVVGALGLWGLLSIYRDRTSSGLPASSSINTLIRWNSEPGEGDFGARLSPSGTMIAFSQTRGAKRQIWTKQIPEGKVNAVTDGDWSNWNPLWSPDSLQIAFVSKRDDQTAIWSIPFTGGELKRIKGMPGDVSLLRWSSDGSKIFFRDKFNVQTLDIASGEITEITHFERADNAQFFNISPREDQIAYSSGPNERLHVFVMPLAGGDPVQVTHDDASDEYPFWLPDGNRIVYSSKRDGIFQFYLAHLDKGTTERVNLDNSDTLISDVARNGNRILLQQVSEESDLKQSEIDKTGDIPISSDTGLEIWPNVSTDGRRLVFQSFSESKHLLEGSIRSLTIDDGRQMKIATNGFYPTIAPDNRKVAFLRDKDKSIDIWVTGINGDDERKVTMGGVLFSGYSGVPNNRTQINDYIWMPDGHDLLYLANPGGLWNIWQTAVDGEGQPHQITNNNDPDVKLTCPVVSPDGDRIAFVSNDIKGAEAVYKVLTRNVSGENDGWAEDVFRSQNVFKLIGWAAAKDRLLIAKPEGKSINKPAVVDLVLIGRGSKPVNVARIESAYYHNIRLSPDGSKIAIATRVEGKDNIALISIPDGSIHKLIENQDPNIYVSGITWSPDSKSIYYSMQKQVVAISMIENFR